MHMRAPVVLCALCLLLTTYHLPLATSARFEPETLKPVGALPAHVTGRFEEPIGLEQAPNGDYFVFDRRSHTVWAYTPGAEAPRKIVQIGAEPGRVIQPTAFDFAPDNTFVVADAPFGRERIQIFSAGGTSLSGFSLPGRALPRLTLDSFVLNGVGSLEYTGSSILISQPEAGALITEYAVDGRVTRTFGELRRTGHESDAELHAALNVGVALPLPDGGYYYVFMAGVPMFRKYDAAGALVFERHVEGIEIDPMVRSLPTTWRARRPNEGEAAVVTPTVRTAAVDPKGRLWISLRVPYTYVYDTRGDKQRVVQFRAAGVLSPASLSFTKDGRVLVTPGCYAFSTK
jgi:hypothetical protein